MSDYEIQRQRHVTGALALAPSLIEQLTWPGDRLAEHRTLRLRELVRIATERSPWYRKRLSAVDVDHLDETALTELPVLTKAELMEHFDGIVTDSRLTLAGLEAHLSNVEVGSYLLGQYTALTSGGSSGQRGVFVYGWDAWAVFWLTCYRTLLRTRASYPDLACRPAVMASVTALSREADVVEYQVRRTPAGAAIAVRCIAPVSLDGLRHRVAAALARTGLDRPRVTVEVVDQFERPGGPAKLKRFVPLDRAPAPLNSER